MNENILMNEKTIKRLIEQARKETLAEVEKMIKDFQLNKMLWNNDIDDWYVHAEDWNEFKQELQKLKENKK